MQKQDLNNAFHIGGSIKTALNGNYRLNSLSIISEAMKLTQKHFWNFLPAIFILILVNFLLFLFFLSIQKNEPMVILQNLFNEKTTPDDYFEAIKYAVFLSSIVSSPLYGGASLMGLSHAIGFNTKPKHILKGLSSAFTAMGAMLCINLLQNASNHLLPLLGFLVGICFSMTILLIYERKLSIGTAMQISVRATIRKLIYFIPIYLLLSILFFFCYATIGIALIWVIPFMFNIKGILYREMFGVGIEVVVCENENSDEIFHA